MRAAWRPCSHGEARLQGCCHTCTSELGCRGLPGALGGGARPPPLPPLPPPGAVFLGRPRPPACALACAAEASCPAWPRRPSRMSLNRLK